jgi:DNA-directed RNA polymerase specialized sigma24 family protein
MDALRSRKEVVALTEQGFRKLLKLLDADAETAAHKYEAIRLRLTGFFQGRGCPFPDELADVTFDRVAKRMEEGEEVRVSDPYFYFRGVASNIFLEQLKRPQPAPLELVPVGQTPNLDPKKVEREKEHLADQERKTSCMRRCFESLSDEKRTLIKEFEQGEKRVRINNRKSMAERLNTNINALRIRIFKIRREIRACRDACLEALAGGG